MNTATTQMNALTLHQPWASLIAAGVKSCETRHWAAPKADWNTLIGIHAGARTDQDFRRRDTEVLRCLGNEPLPTKAIVAIARLHDCVPTETLAPGPLEEHFGDLTPGRYAWRLTDIHPLSEPVPVAGHHKVWTVPPEAVALILSRLLPELPVPLLLQHTAPAPDRPQQTRLF